MVRQLILPGRLQLRVDACLHDAHRCIDTASVVDGRLLSPAKVHLKGPAIRRASAQHVAGEVHLFMIGVPDSIKVVGGCVRRRDDPRMLNATNSRGQGRGEWL